MADKSMLLLLKCQTGITNLNIKCFVGRESS